MDADGLPIVGAAIDLRKVNAIHHKRTRAFLNHFISHTAHFLNKFSCVCEAKLEDINHRIQRIETSLSILEAQLSSIAGLDDTSSPSTELSQQKTIDVPVVTITKPQPVETPIIPSQHPEQNDEDVNPIAVSSPVMTVSQDPRYAKYFKLAQVGVPIMALRPKMIADGLDPHLLNNPLAPVPDADTNLVATSVGSTSSETSTSEGPSDFSD